MPGGRARTFLDRVKARIGPSALILLYHRVGESPTDPQQLAVTPAHFAEHLIVLREYGRAIPLRQLSGALRQMSQAQRR